MNQLIDRHLDRDLSLGEATYLQDAMMNDDELLKRFVDRSRLHDAIRRCVKHSQIDRSVNQRMQPQLPMRSDREASGPSYRIPRIASIAAAIMIGAVLIGLYLNLPDYLSSKTTGSTAGHRLIATLTYAVGEVSGSEFPVVQGVDFSAQTVNIGSGEAEFVLSSGVLINTTGPAEMRIESGMQVAMIRGRASFTCPHDQVGFTVLLPDGAKVVDLGTQFRIHVDDQRRAAVEVLDGVVEVITSPLSGRSQRLEAGHMALLASHSDILRTGHRVLIPLRGDPSHSSTPWPGTRIEQLINDAFAYDPNDPTRRMPGQALVQGGYHTATAAGGAAAVVFDRPHRAIVLDLYGRTDYAAQEYTRHRDLTIELFNGDWDTPVYTQTHFDAITTNQDQPASYGRWVAPPFVVCDRVRISRTGDYMLLMELRAIGLPADQPQTSDSTLIPLEKEQRNESP